VSRLLQERDRPLVSLPPKPPTLMLRPALTATWTKSRGCLTSLRWWN